MPVLRTSNSDVTAHTKANASRVKGKSVSTTVPLPAVSITAATVVASAVAAAVSPKTSIVKQANVKVNTSKRG